jgi:hypothetical protein
VSVHGIVPLANERSLTGIPEHEIKTRFQNRVFLQAR